MSPRDEAWDSAELPAPVPEGLPQAGIHVSYQQVHLATQLAEKFTADIAQAAIAPLADAMMARPALQADLSPNQLFLLARAALERLEWQIPIHDGPLRLTPDLAKLIREQCGDIAQALTAILTLPQMEPDPDA